MQVAEDTPDRDAQVRAARRRQALDALRFEQEREAMLVEQLEDVLAEAEGAVLDAVLFAQMSADDARRVQAALGGGEPWQEAEENVEPDEDDFGLTFDLDDDGADPDATAADEFEAEVARLREVIESSRLVQAALQQYLALVNAG